VAGSLGIISAVAPHFVASNITKDYLK